MQNSDYIMMYNTVLAENKAIDKTVQQMKEANSTDDSKFIYENEELYKLIFINNVLFYVYYLLVIVGVFIFLRKNMNLYIKITSLILIILYPFLIYPIENIIYICVSFVYSFLTGNVYAKKDF
jgi:hypothetical protein